ncbi:MAG: c-type cytochrome [Trichodesmium sp. MAG_R04]|nr:c-type cytochrome [Trichodesmium sp. MAG_R04]
MKKLLSIVVLAIIFVVVALQPSALAADVAHGGKIFKANCNACHVGGNNRVNPRKTLAKTDLEKYGMFNEEKIITQVTKGKAPMPSFGRLGKKSIEDVAAYVLEQAERGWK